MKLFLLVTSILLCLQPNTVHCNGNVQANTQNVPSAINSTNPNMKHVFGDQAAPTSPTMNYSYMVIVEDATIKVTSTKESFVGKKKVAGSFVVSIGKKKFVNPQEGKVYTVGALRFNRLPNDVFEIINRKDEAVDIFVCSATAKVFKTNGMIGTKPVRYEKHDMEGSTVYGYYYNMKTKTHMFEISESLEKKPKGYPSLFKACVSSFLVRLD